MNTAEHAQLLRELANELYQYDSANPYHDFAPLIARARQAADEIERDSHTITVAISDESMAGLKAMCEDVVASQVTAEIKGREVASDEELNRCFDDALSKEFEAVWAGPQPFDHYSLDNQRIRERKIQLAGLRAVLARFGGGEVK